MIHRDINIKMVVRTRRGERGAEEGEFQALGQQVLRRNRKVHLRINDLFRGGPGSNIFDPKWQSRRWTVACREVDNRLAGPQGTSNFSTDKIME
jgi:hypothetical protein